LIKSFILKGIKWQAVMAIILLLGILNSFLLVLLARQECFIQVIT